MVLRGLGAFSCLPGLALDVFFHLSAGGLMEPSLGFLTFASGPPG